jgi:hypothetical protein
MYGGEINIFVFQYAYKNGPLYSCMYSDNNNYAK